MRYGGSGEGVYGGYGRILFNPTFTGTADATGLTSIAGMERLVAQSAIPFILISSGSIADNGALTAVTALPTTYSGGAYCYFPAAAIVAGGAAGWYWTVFSSGTAGTIYNSTYTSGVPVAGTATAFVTTGPGAFVGVTTEIVGPSIALAAGALGPNGLLRVIAAYAGTNSGGSKQFFQYLNGTGGSAVVGANIAANRTYIQHALVMNRNSNARQFVPTGGANGTGGWGAMSADATHLTVNLANAATYDFSLVHSGAATDNMILEGFEIIVSYKA